ncbi:MAG: Gmad2 immunoglobulin-like domain-containing protein [Patescibacteria group bacterium]|nr:Gmad2 immunoglobulin-like domain-containing protein [Patescibacteria group bacterium]
MKKSIIIFSGLLILGIGLFALCEYFWQKNNNSPAPIIIGGDKDDNGCLVGAGYSWCTSNEKCQRMWEEYCPEFADAFKIENFDDCVSAGNPVMESYPRQCNTKDGQHFTEEIGNELSLQDKIILDNPRPNQIITSPLTITGKARGTWFFEASFPVVLTDWDGIIIAQGIATAKSDWMTEDFVPFEATLTFQTPTYKNNGSLILKKDNPSGLPEYDEALEIPVLFDIK